MDEILSKAGSQAVTFAIRSGISIASTYAVKSVTKFLAKVPDDQRIRLERTKQKLQTRIEIVSSAIDLIKLVASRGNTNLESTLRLTKDLKEEIDRFDDKIQEASENYSAHRKDSNSVNNVELYMLDLLSRIEEAIPLINLSLTTSGANLSGTLSNQVSPGRLLQASNYVNKSNEEFSGKLLQIGPSFQLTLYSIFYHRGRIINNRLNEISWKEEFTRAVVSIWRQPSKVDVYEYVLRIKENFDDDRYHDDDDEPQIIELDISTITRLFFSASGKLLKLEDRSTPVLVLKINKSFKDVENDEDDEEHEESNPIEWLSFGEYEELYQDSESEDEDDEKDRSSPKKTAPQQPSNPHSSLSLLEYVLRLCVLQSNDQSSILEVNDERLALYLNDENNNERSTSMITTNESELFENDSSSSPVRIINERTKKKTNSSKTSTPTTSPKVSEITSRLKKVGVDDVSDSKDPSTPQKNGAGGSKGSPLPGDVESSVKLTPWERDKISKLRDTPVVPGGSYGTPTNTLRKKVLRRNLND